MADLAREDLSNKKVEIMKDEIIKPISEKANQIDDLEFKEYEKLSVSIPTELFDTLQDISRKRRRAGQKYTMSHMVRESLNLWLNHNGLIKPN